jgi:serine/threonine protein phosphatase PrpC
VSLTEDHKPNNTTEKERIENGGGFVQFNRVNGELAMSRALGDFRYKLRDDMKMYEQLVIPIPDISIHERSAEDRVAVLACDGVWDVIQNEESIDFLTEIVFGEPELQMGAEKNTKKRTRVNLPTSSMEAAENLIALALKDGSQDNISAIVIKFPSLTTK